MKAPFCQTGRFNFLSYWKQPSTLKTIRALKTAALLLAGSLVSHVTENDIITNPSKPDPIMVSSFPIDSHDCQRIVRPDGKVVNEGTVFPVKPPGDSRGYPYHVPYRAILPLPAECDNLLVPVALSCTHIAMSSLRIEATWMLIGQSAGIAAALAADRDVAVQDLPYAVLKPRLLARDQAITLPPEFLPAKGSVVDDPDAIERVIDFK